MVKNSLIYLFIQVINFVISKYMSEAERINKWHGWFYLKTYEAKFEGQSLLCEKLKIPQLGKNFTVS
jgi:hypothetical protein